jgi:hypothetical protein
LQSLANRISLAKTKVDHRGREFRLLSHQRSRQRRL